MLRFNKENTISLLGFDDRLFMFIGIPLISLFAPLAFFQVDIFSIDLYSFIKLWFQMVLHSTTYWLGIRAFMLYIRRRFPEIEHTKKRILYQVLFTLIFALSTSIIIEELTGNLLLLKYYISEIQGLITTTIITVIILSIYEVVYLYTQNKNNILAQEALKRNHILSQLQGLRNQVNPHFLFNSLNTLMNIIPTDPALATSFLKNLSQVYRYLLVNKDEHLVTLREEIDFIESYVFLQKERFKNSFNVEIKIADNYFDHLVVPLSLQLLFENAIKHNTVSTKYPLLIEVYVDDKGQLVTQNKIRQKKQAMVSTGVGLANIKSRLSFFTDQPMVIESVDDVFIVRLPLLTIADKEVRV